MRYWLKETDTGSGCEVGTLLSGSPILALLQITLPNKNKNMHIKKENLWEVVNLMKKSPKITLSLLNLSMLLYEAKET